MLKVLEIFHSIDGEGTRAGELTTFIRLAGCNLHCRYCDTAYSINPKEWKEMSVEEVISKVQYRNVTVTGGEPLLQEDAWILCKSLAEQGHSVNIETNGTIVPPVKPRGLEESIFFTIDYKCGASGHEKDMNPEAFKNLKYNDVIKCVVGSVEDMESALANLQKWNPILFRQYWAPPWVYFSPVFGKIEPAEIVEFMKQNNLEGKCRVQLQLHKFIWDPNRKEV